MLYKIKVCIFFLPFSSCYMASKTTIFILFTLFSVVSIIVVIYYTDIMVVTAGYISNVVFDQKVKGQRKYLGFILQDKETNLTSDARFENILEHSPKVTRSTTSPSQTTAFLSELKSKPNSLQENSTRPVRQSTESPQKQTNITVAESTTERSHSAAMTFNSSLEVLCKESPFIDCGTQNVKHFTTQKTFKMSMLRRPAWLSTTIYNMSSCKYNACQFGPFNESKETEAVLVYGVGLSDSEKPSRRWEHQTYVMALWESPVHTKSDFINSKEK